MKEDCDIEPPKKIQSDKLQELYEKMLNTRSDAKKAENEWRYYLHQMYYTRDPDADAKKQ